MNSENTRQSLELAHILEQYGKQYSDQYNPCTQQRKALTAISSCRTSALGGHASQCNHCGYQSKAYNSCRNKHCPKCQFIKQEKWVDKLKGRLLPVKHFHFVFTIPDALHTMFYINQAQCYSILFAAAWMAIRKASANPRFSGAQTGGVALLHTWTQTLNYHPHIHMLVPSGGISEDHMEWIASRKNFLVPIKVVGLIFRGCLCSLLEKGLNAGEIIIPENESWKQLKKQLYLKNWIIYAQKPIGGVNGVLKYLGRYAHRVAITNSRISEMSEDHVSFRYQDNKDHGKSKIMRLQAVEFIRRFMTHILPDNFYKIRYYGVMAAVNTKTIREQCLALIGKMNDLTRFVGLTDAEVYRFITGKDNLCCPQCNLWIMIVFRKIPLPNR